MSKLVTMYGKKLGAPQYQFSLFSMSGNGGNMNDDILNINPTELSNIDAGIQVLYAIEKEYPGITWGELISMSRKSKLGNIFGDFGNWVADKAGAVGDKLGDWGGSAVRLVTDKEVKDGITSYAASYATGGGSSALEGLFGEDSGISLSQIKQLVSGLGQSSKQEVQAAGFGGMDFGNIDPKLLMIGGGALILLVLLLK